MRLESAHNSSTISSYLWMLFERVLVSNSNISSLVTILLIMMAVARKDTVRISKRILILLPIYLLLQWVNINKKLLANNFARSFIEKFNLVLVNVFLTEEFRRKIFTVHSCDVC